MERYQFLDEYKDFQIPELIADFKVPPYFILLRFNKSERQLYWHSQRIIKERLNQRFANYLESNTDSLKYPL